MGDKDRPMEFLVSRLVMHTNLSLSNTCLLFIFAALIRPGLLWAAPEDTLSPYIARSISYDDNFFRLTTNPESEKIKQTIAGVKLNWKQSRQNVVIDASVANTKFDRFSELDYLGKNFLALWNWQLGNDFNGAAGYTYVKTLGSYAETQQVVNNLITQQHTFFDGAWQVHSRLRLNGAISRDTYSQPSSSANGNETMNYEADAYYTPPSGNELGVRAMHQVGIYPVEQLVDGTLVNNNYTQDELLATIYWLYSGHIQANGQAGVVSRKQEQLSARDFSGTTMRGKITWLATGKSNVDVSVWDEVDAYDDLTTSYTLSKGVSLGAIWNPTAKVSVTAKIQHVGRDFLGDPGLVLGPPQPVRHDNVNSASLFVAYQPIRAVNISGSIQNEHRTSNQPSYDYADNFVNLTISFEL